MPLPLPKNCRPDEQGRGFDFEVKIEGRNWKASISLEVLKALYPRHDPIRALSQSSHIARKVAERVRAGDVEPIYLSSTMFNDKGR